MVYVLANCSSQMKWLFGSRVLFYSIPHPSDSTKVQRELDVTVTLEYYC